MNTTQTIQTAAEGMSNAKLAAIMLKGCEHFATMFAESESAISEAIENAAEIGMAEEKEPPVTIGFQVKLDLGRNKQSGKISVAIRKTNETESPIPDPNQPELL